MTTLLGADLNGVVDHRVGRDLDGQAEAADVGIRGSLVRLEEDGTWVAGPQAAMAPHGRGDAWGSIGAEGNRIYLADLHEDLLRHEPGELLTDAATTALPSILMECELATFAIPDTPASNDLYRERYLRLLRRVRGVRRPMLLWRSIAAYLGWIQSKPVFHRPGQRIGVLSLMLDGLHFSLLDTEAHSQGKEQLLVPVRRRFGDTTGGAFRGQAYIDELLARMSTKSGLPAHELQHTQTPWRIATGHRAELEVLKRNGANRWIRLPEISATPGAAAAAEIPSAFAAGLSKIDVLLIEGPFAGQRDWVNAIKAALSKHIHSECHTVSLDRGCVARGCLEASGRFREGQPIYFDFLPGLQINALVGREPRFVDLIAAKTRCVGGRTFKANAKGQYVIGRGATRLRFWLFKEDFERGRKIEIPLEAPSDNQYPLSISVEQSPGQGLACVQISSAEYEELRRSPIVLDWTQMEEVRQSRDQIVQKLKDDIGLSYPDAAVTKGHPILWLPTHPRGPLLDLLRRFTETPLVRSNKIVPSTREVLHALRERFSRAEPLAFFARRLKLRIEERGTVNLLNGDGSLPQEANGLAMPPQALSLLQQAVAKLELDVADVRRTFGSLVDEKLMSDVIGFASWCFHRCPDNLVQMMLESYEERADYRINSNMLREGLGRVIFAPIDLRRYFNAAERRLQKAETLTKSEYAALGRILGGVDVAARTLQKGAAVEFMQDAIAELRAANKEGAYKVRLKAVLKLIMALLRHREIAPDFCDPEGRLGEELIAALQEADKGINKLASDEDKAALKGSDANRARHRSRARRLRENSEIVRKTIPFVEMQGKHKDIIAQIDAMNGGDGGDGDGDATDEN